MIWLAAGDSPTRNKTPSLVTELRKLKQLLTEYIAELDYPEISGLVLVDV